jgi:hypothetical protein
MTTEGEARSNSSGSGSLQPLLSGAAKAAQTVNNQTESTLAHTARSAR